MLSVCLSACLRLLQLLLASLPAPGRGRAVGAAGGQQAGWLPSHGPALAAAAVAPGQALGWRQRTGSPCSDT